VTAQVVDPAPDSRCAGVRWGVTRAASGPSNGEQTSQSTSLSVAHPQVRSAPWSRLSAIAYSVTPPEQVRTQMLGTGVRESAFREC
jgi:hypothetical protein